MQTYLNLLQDILNNGRDKGDRTGTGTRSVFGRSMRFNLAAGFPLLTTKKVHLKGIVAELLWFIGGMTNAKQLNAMGAKIWDEWALENGDLGPIYGKQWTAWDDTRIVPNDDVEQYRAQGFTLFDEFYHADDKTTYAVMRREINQIEGLLRELLTKPDSRRNVVTAWNPAVVPDDRYSPQENVSQGRAALPACHTLFQLYTDELTTDERLAVLLDRGFEVKPKAATEAETVAFMDALNIPKRRLSCNFYCRSQDVFLGTTYNIASYAVLTHLLAKVCNMTVGELIWNGGDCHIYSNHMEQVKEQLSRTPRAQPTLKIFEEHETTKNIIQFRDDTDQQVYHALNRLRRFKVEDITVEGYDPHPAIKAPVAI